MRQLVPFPLPEAHTRPVTPSSIGTDQQPFRLGILVLTNRLPPASDAFHRESGRIMIHAHIDPARILPQIVHSAGPRPSQAGDGEIIDTYLLRLPLRPPFASRILEIAHQSLLLPAVP